MPTIGQQSSAASDSAADIGDSADIASLCSLPRVVQGFRDNSDVGHRQRSSLEAPASATLACSINPGFNGTKAKSYGRGHSTAVSNRAAASRAALRRRH